MLSISRHYIQAIGFAAISVLSIFLAIDGGRPAYEMRMIVRGGEDLALSAARSHNLSGYNISTVPGPLSTIVFINGSSLDEVRRVFEKYYNELKIFQSLEEKKARNYAEEVSNWSVLVNNYIQTSFRERNGFLYAIDSGCSSARFVVVDCENAYKSINYFISLVDSAQRIGAAITKANVDLHSLVSVPVIRVPHIETKPRYHSPMLLLFAVVSLIACGWIMREKRLPGLHVAIVRDLDLNPSGVVASIACHWRMIFVGAVISSVVFAFWMRADYERSPASVVTNMDISGAMVATDAAVLEAVAERLNTSERQLEGLIKFGPIKAGISTESPEVSTEIYFYPTPKINAVKLAKEVIASTDVILQPNQGDDFFIKKQLYLDKYIAEQYGIAIDNLNIVTSIYPGVERGSGLKTLSEFKTVRRNLQKRIEEDEARLKENALLTEGGVSIRASSRLNDGIIYFAVSFIFSFCVFSAVAHQLGSGHAAIDS